MGLKQRVTLNCAKCLERDAYGRAIKMVLYFSMDSCL